MADTIRTLSALQTLLADNSSRDVSAQDLRDMLVSVHGVYGGLYVKDGATAQSATTTPAKMTGWAGNMDAAGTTPDHTDDSITVGTDGVYLIWCHISFFGNGSANYQGFLRIDGVEQSEGFKSYVSGAAYMNPGFVAVKSLSAGEKITVYIESSAGGGADFTPVDGQLACHRVA